MDLFKAQLERIQQQLGGLNASQKMLTAALVAIMGITLLWWGKYAGEPEMQPLLSQPFADEELGRLTTQLDGRGVKYEVTADKHVLVPADRKISLLSALFLADALPKNTANGFDEIIKQLTPWDGQDRQNMMFNRGKEMTLSKVIGEFPGVASASVMIDPNRERHIAGNTESTAFVSVKMKGEAKPPKPLVNAVARAVLGAQTGLLLKNIQVLINGTPYHARPDGDDDSSADTVFEAREREEKYLSNKVSEQLVYIPGVLVAVTVSVDPTSSDTTAVKYGDIKSKEVKTEEDTSEQTTPGAPPPAEPGASPNVGTSGTIGSSGVATVAAAGGTGGASHTRNHNTAAFANFADQQNTHSRTPAGRATPTGASVRIPQSYFIRIAKKGPAEPSEAAVQDKTKEVLQNVREQVRTCVGLPSPAAVTVEPYYDQVPLADTPVAAATASSLSLAVGGHFKEIALGALALVSLFMVSTIVKKGTPPPPAPRAPAARAGPQILEGGELLAGEAAEGNPLLDGMELDDDAVKTQQMLQQVSTMVQENPDAAAQLVKRWLNRA